MNKPSGLFRAGAIAVIAIACQYACAANPDTDASRSSVLPATPRVEIAEIQDAVNRGRRFLLENRNQDGSLGNARHTKKLNIYAPAPGSHQAFRTAVSAMAFQALLVTAENPNDQDLINLRQWLQKHLPDVRRPSPDVIYNVWTHAYGLQALSAALTIMDIEDPERQMILKTIQTQIRRLQAYETVHGGWAYYNFGPRTKVPSSYSNSFVNATVLIALHDASEQGIEVPAMMRGRAMRALQRQRKPDGSYLYSEDWKHSPMREVNQPGGSLSRSQAGNLALKLWECKTITPEIQRAWLNRLITRHGWLDMARKRPVPHESWYSVAGYYYYFGLYYASRNIEHLPQTEQSIYARHLARLILDRQLDNGSWWDFPLYNYHPFYGTAFALLTLQHCSIALAPDTANNE